MAKRASETLYGYVVMTPGASAYGFKEDTLPELRPTEVPPQLRAAARRDGPPDTTSDSDAVACTRYFGRHPPYVVLFVFECPTTGMITDNTLVVLFLPNSSGGYTVRRDSDAWGDIEPAWRNKQGVGGGLGGRPGWLNVPVRKPS